MISILRGNLRSVSIFRIFSQILMIWSNLKGSSICCNLNIVFLASDETNILTQSHRIWEWLRAGGGGFANPSAPSRLSYHRSPGIMCSSIFNISMDRDCTASLSKLCQCLTILTMKCFLVFTWNFLICNVLFLVCTHCFLSFRWVVYTPQIFMHIDEIPWAFCAPGSLCLCF